MGPINTSPTNTFPRRKRPTKDYDYDYEDKDADDDDGADDNVAMAKSRGFWEIEWGEVPSPHLLMAATWGTYKVLMAFLHFYINLVQLYKYVWPN